MTSRGVALAISAFLASHAAGQTYLYGVRANGDLVRLNPQTGAGVLVGNSGFPCTGSAGYHVGAPYFDETYIFTTGAGAEADELIAVRQWDASSVVRATIAGRPAGYGFRGMTLGYAILGTGNPADTELVSLNTSTGAVTVIGPTGRADLESLAADSAGHLFALGAGTLYAINPGTGAATLIGGSGFGEDTHALTFLPDGTLLACGAGLRSVNPATGAATLIGPTGFGDIRGLAALNICYPHCSGSATTGVNVGDFTCFLMKFAGGSAYANCDESTTPPILNVSDFTCFLQKFAAGCTVS